MRSGRRRCERGFTLIELLVVMVIFGVIGGVVTTTVIASLRSATATTARIEAMNELEIAMQRMARDFRVADPIELSGSGAYGTSLGASILRGGERSEIRYRIVAGDNGQLLVRDDGDVDSVLITAIDNGVQEVEGEDEAVAVPVFRYLDRLGRELECTGDCESIYLRADMIEIRLVRVIEGRRAAIVESRVNVRNLRHGSI